MVDASKQHRAPVQLSFRLRGMRRYLPWVWLLLAMLLSTLGLALIPREWNPSGLAPDRIVYGLALVYAALIPAGVLLIQFASRRAHFFESLLLLLCVLALSCLALDAWAETAFITYYREAPERSSKAFALASFACFFIGESTRIRGWQRYAMLAVLVLLSLDAISALVGVELWGFGLFAEIEGGHNGNRYPTLLLVLGGVTLIDVAWLHWKFLRRVCAIRKAAQ